MFHNVHQFDGMLPPGGTQIEIDVRERKKIFSKYTPTLSRKESKHMVDIIVNQIGKSSDIDLKNHSYEASLLLAWCFLNVPVDVLEEQLVDMYLMGKCVQRSEERR